MTDIHYLTLSDVCRRAKSGELSAVAIADAMLARIETLDPELGSFVTVLADAARARAESLDAKRKAGEPLGLLHAAPIALKDLLFTKGIKTTGGMRVFEDWVPQENATVVERLESAGALCLGKVKLTEGAYGEHHPDVQAPVNPWNAQRWTGVSSSGSGVAVAAGLAHGAIGTDTGGSIRFPSACGGIVGIKPTYGRVSRHGGFVLADSMDHFGPMTRSVADAARMLQVMAGHDPKDPTSLRDDVPNYLAPGPDNLMGVRIGVDRDYVESGVDTAVIATIDDALAVCIDRGATVVEVQMPERHDLVERWAATCGVECALAHERTFPERADDYGPALRQLIEFGREKISALEYARLERQREVFRAGLETLLTGVDVLMIPSMPVPPPTLEWIEADPRERAEAPLLTFTAPFDYSGHPTITLPLDLDADGLPRSLQLVGRLLGEARLIEIAAVFEREVAFESHPIA